VEFAGFATPEELPRFYASADVFCSPATGGESFGLVVMEAMASGKPVVATAIPGHQGILTHGVEGVMVPPESAQSLAVGLVRLLADRERAAVMGTAGRQTALGYSWTEIARRVLDQYDLAARLQRRVAAISVAAR
jgi:phosphatidylinositol alpha-mannosyltransferase